MERRFFCTIYARDRNHLIELGQLDFDVFRPTARLTERHEHAIEGLLTLDQVAKLVENGYRVLVEEDSSKRARASELIMSAEDWIREFEKRR
jgi:hypothetical protein